MQDYKGCYSAPCQLRENYFDVVTKTIEDEAYVKRSRSEDGGKGFTRDRKITFVHLIVLLIQGISKSLQRDLNSFYQKLQHSDFNIQYVTKSAFSQSRSKLKPEAFLELNQVGLKSFYKDADWRKFNGLRLLAIDGSTAVLPKHKSIDEEFGITNFGPYADSPRSVARMSILYDVLNLTTLDAQIDKYDISERELARRHFEFVEPKTDLLLLDRGYPSIALMFEMQCLGINYLIRMRDNWWHEIRKMIADGEKDKEVTFKLPEKEKALLKKYNTDTEAIRCRLVCVELEDGAIEILCTSVLDKQLLPYQCFNELYHYRWNIEEAYKLLKSRLQLEAFSGKTALAVKQDFFAKIFTLTTAAVMTFPVDAQLKAEQKASKRKHEHKVNRTNALAMIREISKKVFIDGLIKPAIEALDKFLKATTELVRRNRKFERKKLKKKPPSMNYKGL
jgi:hypothetical protein